MAMILVVEDDIDMAATCSLVLERGGYEVQVAHDAEEALRKIMAHKPDLLISDCVMPGRTGLELTQQLRTLYSRAMLPILLMSGARRASVARCDSYDGFLCKPFVAESLLAAVEKLLNGRHGASVGGNYVLPYTKL
jgi:DNA-binding response OmpR family regulator